MSLTALELLPREAHKCSAQMASSGLTGKVHVTSAIKWTARNNTEYDVAVGNPPFVRFQFVSDSDKAAIPRLENRLGLSFKGVSNLWLPVLLGTMNLIAVGGAFAFIVPAECFTGISAGVMRDWLVRNTSSLRFDLFSPGSFPSVLQEVVIMQWSSRKTQSHAIAMRDPVSTLGTGPQPQSPIQCHQEHGPGHVLANESTNGGVEEASALADVWRLGDVARFEVAAVTGANEYFSVTQSTIKEFGWRIGHCHSLSGRAMRRDCVTGNQTTKSPNYQVRRHHFLISKREEQTH